MIICGYIRSPHLNMDDSVFCKATCSPVCSAKSTPSTQAKIYLSSLQTSTAYRKCVVWTHGSTSSLIALPLMFKAVCTSISSDERIQRESRLFHDFSALINHPLLVHKSTTRTYG